MGEAAKSNVEKRKVGCVITLDDKIIATGFNTEEIHAEVAACESLIKLSSCAGLPEDCQLKAWVSHPPCPDCAKIMADHGITEVEVVEEFMKFDGDKLRYDLVDGDFMLHYHELLGAIQTKLLPIELCELAKKKLWIKDLQGLIDAIWQGSMNVEESLAKVLTFGARKYKPNNWRKNTDIGRYWAAAHRHLNAHIKGEELDPESGFSHIDHLWCNIMFIWVLDKDARNSTTSSTD